MFRLKWKTCFCLNSWVVPIQNYLSWHSLLLLKVCIWNLKQFMYQNLQQSKCKITVMETQLNNIRMNSSNKIENEKLKLQSTLLWLFCSSWAEEKYINIYAWILLDIYTSYLIINNIVEICNKWMLLKN